MKIEWGTVLFFSSIGLVCSTVALIAGIGFSIMHLDPHPFYYTGVVFIFFLILEFVAGAKVEEG